MAAKKNLKVTLIRSVCKAIPNHKKCAIGLGLRKTNSSAIVADNQCIRGMINKISHLLSVEEV